MESQMNWEMIVGASGCVIALCALMLSIWQGVQARRHNKISFRPHLTTWFHEGNNSGHFQLDLINNGLGPAVISEFRVLVDEKKISGTGLEPLNKLIEIIFKGYQYKSKTGYVSPGYSMSAKERCSLITLDFDSDWPTESVMEHLIKRIDIQVEYRSFYDESFSMDLHE